jgi:hypothetical protein
MLMKNLNLGHFKFFKGFLASFRLENERKPKNLPQQPPTTPWVYYSASWGTRGRHGSCWSGPWPSLWQRWDPPTLVQSRCSRRLIDIVCSCFKMDFSPFILDINCAICYPGYEINFQDLPFPHDYNDGGSFDSNCPADYFLRIKS